MIEYINLFYIYRYYDIDIYFYCIFIIMFLSDIFIFFFEFLGKEEYSENIFRFFRIIVLILMLCCVIYI